MGDTTGYSVRLDPTGISDDQLDALAAHIGFHSFGGFTVDRHDSHVAINDDERSICEAPEIAEKVRDWLRAQDADRAFSVQEDPTGEWLGTLVSYHPSDPDALHDVACDDDGNPILSASSIADIVKGAGGSYDKLVAALSAHLGQDMPECLNQPWSAEVDTWPTPDGGARQSLLKFEGSGSVGFVTAEADDVPEVQVWTVDNATRPLRVLVDDKVVVADAYAVGKSAPWAASVEVEQARGGAQSVLTLPGVRVALIKAEKDGKPVVWIDTYDEPETVGVRVNVNDGGVFGYPQAELPPYVVGQDRAADLALLDRLATAYNRGHLRARSGSCRDCGLGLEPRTPITDEFSLVWVDSSGDVDCPQGGEHTP